METEKLTGTGSLPERLANFIQSLGLDTFGFTNGEIIRQYQTWYDARPSETISPFETGAPSDKCRLDGQFVSIAFPYAHDLVWPGDAHFSVYVRGRDYHRIVRAYLDRVAVFIRELGYSADVYVDTNALPERLIAALAGVGWLGRNSTLITRGYGSWVFLGEIRTDLPLIPNRDYTEPGDHALCGDCQRCLAACPVNILGDEYVATGKCLSALTQQKNLARTDLLRLDGRLFGCDTCQRVCPYDQDKAQTGLAEFTPLDQMVYPDLEELSALSKGQFASGYAPTSAGWRGKGVLQINALAALARLGRLPASIRAGSPAVRAAYDTLKTRIDDPEMIE